jgi:hypothetical protein
MNKELYIKRLRLLIRALPNGERETVVDFYREMIDDKIENGETQEQAVAGLGDVNALAQKILMENPNRKPRDTQSVISIALASFCGVFIVAAIVIFIYSLMTVPVNMTGSAQSSTEQIGKMEKKIVTSPVDGVTSIVINAENKDVVLSQSTGDTVNITYFTDNTQSYTVTTENGEMKLVNKDHASHGSFYLFPEHGDHTSIIISVPQSYNGAISANTGNGDIVLTQIKVSKLDLKSSNGDIVLKAVTSPELILDTSNGDITGSICGKEDDYTIQTGTSNGECSPRSRSGGSKKLTADTSNADINIEFTN